MKSGSRSVLPGRRSSPAVAGTDSRMTFHRGSGTVGIWSAGGSLPSTGP